LGTSVVDALFHAPVILARRFATLDQLSGGRVFRAAAQAAGRDAAGLKVMVRANVPITDGPMSDNRPFLGGSPEQIADDLNRVRDLGVDHVFFSNRAAPPVDDQVRLLERLQQATS
jgi:alkanesulfonate monooxygenase SsuD/methylene tetrahydromethanopterin reductase-like flavin-dependent oxidoreductase (luciferase family)